jgi:GNAT superfamily N-acetyltransferase
MEPDRIEPGILEQVRLLIQEGGGVGVSYLRDNLRNAFLIGYALDGHYRVVGTVTHKRPKEEYRRKLESYTGLDLSGFLERGYTAVAAEYRYHRIADRLIKGLIDRSKDLSIYVTIRMDNIPALKLTFKNGMTLAATFVNSRGDKIGIFTNQPPL